MVLKVAVLGAGIFAKEAHLPAIKANSSLTTLTAIWSRSASTVEPLGDFAKSELGYKDVKVYSGDAGLKELLSSADVEAVIIALPIVNQPAYVRQVLAAGKHVLSEKPVAATVQEGKELIAEYEKTYKGKGLVWQVAEQFQYEERYIKAKEIIESGTIGKPIFFRQTIMGYTEAGNKWYETPWRKTSTHPGGFLLDGGVHFTAAVKAILGPVKTVAGFATLSHEHLGPQDTINAIVETESGVPGTALITFGSAPTMSIGPETFVCGDKGHIFMKPGGTAPDGSAGWTLETHVKGEEVKKEVIGGNAISAEVKFFAETVGGKHPKGPAGELTGTPQAALQDLAFVEACLTGQGKLITLKDM